MIGIVRTDDRGRLSAAGSGAARSTAARGTRKVRVLPGVATDSGFAVSSVGPIATLSPGQNPAPLTVIRVPGMPRWGVEPRCPA